MNSSVEPEKIISNELLNHLKRHFEVYDVYTCNTKMKMINVGKKQILLQNNKKYIVNMIFGIIKETYYYIDESISRRTIKYFIDKTKINLVDIN